MTTYIAYSNHTNTRLNTTDTGLSTLNTDSQAHKTATNMNLTVIQTNIDNLEDTVDANDTTVKALIATEKTRAEGEESRIEGKLDTAVTRLDAYDVTLKDKIDEIFTDEFVLSAGDTVTQKLKDEDSALTTALATAISDRNSKDTEHDGRFVKSSANDLNLKAIFSTLIPFLEKFFDGITITDSNNNTVTHPDWAQLLTTNGNVEAHAPQISPP